MTFEDNFRVIVYSDVHVIQVEQANKRLSKNQQYTQFTFQFLSIV